MRARSPSDLERYADADADADAGIGLSNTVPGSDAAAVTIAAENRLQRSLWAERHASTSRR